MKHKQIIRAYLVLDRIKGDEIPLAISYKLFKVKQMIQPQWDFQKERIDAIIKKYEPKRLFDGSMKFKNQAEGEKCADEINKMLKEIDEMDVDFADVKKQSIRLDTDIKLSIDDIDALSEFITFEE